MDSLAQDGSQQLWQLLCVFGAPPILGLPLFWGSPSPSVTSFSAFAILGLSWEETSVTLPGNRKGVMTSRCAGKHPAPPPGAARPSGSVGAGRPLFPLSDTGCKECPGLNGPCVKMWDGGQSPSTPLKAGPEQEAAHGLGCTVSELSPLWRRAFTDPPWSSLSLHCSPSPSLHVPTVRPVELGLHRHPDLAGWLHPLSSPAVFTGNKTFSSRACPGGNQVRKPLRRRSILVWF